MAKLTVLLSIALRNLFSSFLNVAIGILLLIATFLLATGSGVLNAVERAMKESISGSVVGDLQLYSSQSRDDLEIWGPPDILADVTPLQDYATIESIVAADPNVRSVIPMGVGVATVTEGNELDVALERLRKAVNAKAGGESNPPGATEAERLAAIDQVRQTLRATQDDVERADLIAGSEAFDPAALELLTRSRSDAYWESFAADPYPLLEQLENQVAPALSVPVTHFIRYVATDLEKLKASSTRLRVVEGTHVPSGKRGILLPKRFMEDALKLRVARRLDLIQQGRSRGESIASSDALKRLVEQNKEEAREILVQLNTGSSAELTQLLRAELAVDKPLADLLVQFLGVDDETFERRYRLFYDQLAPLLRLYSTRVGEQLTLRSFTRSGASRAINVHVYGAFEFEGLEQSGLANALCLMDLISYRELQDLRGGGDAEVAELRRAAGLSALADVGREDAEARLFVDDGRAAGTLKEPEALDWSKLEQLEVEGPLAESYDVAELRRGPVSNVSVVTVDPRTLSPTRERLEQALTAAGVPARVVLWTEAAGAIGKFVAAARGALALAVFIILLLAMLIINNAVTIATLRRVREIGTLRAIGAQRSFVLAMILIESLALALVFGLVGGLLSSGLLFWLHSHGIAAPADEVRFFFAGPALYPSPSVLGVAVPLLLVTVVSVLSAAYPAFLASRIAPVRAMQDED